MDSRRMLLLILGLVSLSVTGFYLLPWYAAISNTSDVQRKLADRTVKQTPKPQGQANGGASNPAASDEGGSPAYEKYATQIREYFYQDRFDQLDAIAGELRASKARFIGGAWKLQVLSRPG